MANRYVRKHFNGLIKQYKHVWNVFEEKHYTYYQLENHWKTAFPLVALNSKGVFRPNLNRIFRTAWLHTKPAVSLTGSHDECSTSGLLTWTLGVKELRYVVSMGEYSQVAKYTPKNTPAAVFAQVTQGENSLCVWSEHTLKLCIRKTKLWCSSDNSLLVAAKIH